MPFETAVSPLLWLGRWKLTVTEMREQREPKTLESYIRPSSLETTHKLFVVKKINGLSGLSTSLSCWLFRENEATTNLLEIVLVQEIPAMRICESLSHKHAFQFPGFQSLVRHNSSIRFSPTSFFFSPLLTTPPIQQV